MDGGDIRRLLALVAGVAVSGRILEIADGLADPFTQLGKPAASEDHDDDRQDDQELSNTKSHEGIVALLAGPPSSPSQSRASLNSDCALMPPGFRRTVR